MGCGQAWAQSPASHLPESLGDPELFPGGYLGGSRGRLKSSRSGSQHTETPGGDFSELIIAFSVREIHPLSPKTTELSLTGELGHVVFCLETESLGGGRDREEGVRGPLSSQFGALQSPERSGAALGMK